LYKRLLNLPKSLDNSFFLWGPRQVGKTSLLKETYPDAPFIQLLRSDEFALFQSYPERLRERIRKNGWNFVIIDEIQKVPQLLDEVHLLIEEDGVVFGLCGSSARKVRKGHANLLGGRALRYEMSGLVAAELGSNFSLERILNHGYMPLIYDSDESSLRLKSYCSDYLKEEIFAEGLVRKLQPFSRFLEISALGDTEVLNYETVARDCGVSAPTVRSYYEILVDTLLARYLPAYTFRPKRRVSSSPKFYFSDVGVVNHLAQRGQVLPKSISWGKAFENWVFHELVTYIEYRGRSESLSYWRLTTGVEVDFIVGSMKVGIEAKASSNIHSDHLKGLRELAIDYPELQKKIVVSMENESRVTDDGIEILSYQDFVQSLWAGRLF
jgi:predicted AAA+ superfamily ATPase